jgi:hypothetical protein
MTNPQNNLPSAESLNELFEGLNSALKKFLDSNPTVEKHIVLSMVIRSMLVFPLDWMRNSGTEVHYIDMMTDHINSVYASFILKEEP